MARRPEWPSLHPAYVSGYERGEREPLLPVLLRYAELANVYVDALIYDRLDLSHVLPARKKILDVR
jgi:transcriptional regulator with XRE-family HTH domain